MTDAELGKWLREWKSTLPWAADLGGPIAVIAALVALLGEAEDTITRLLPARHSLSETAQARLRTVLKGE